MIPVIGIMCGTGSPPFRERWNLSQQQLLEKAGKFPQMAMAFKKEFPSDKFYDKLLHINERLTRWYPGEKGQEQLPPILGKGPTILAIPQFNLPSAFCHGNLSFLQKKGQKIGTYCTVQRRALLSSGCSVYPKKIKDIKEHTERYFFMADNYIRIFEIRKCWKIALPQILSAQLTNFF
jgi:hypothetical protein